MTRDDVIDVLTAVAAATRRSVGEADVEIWMGVLGDLPLMGLVKGKVENLPLLAVRDHLADCPGVWLEPGHVYQRVRAMVRDQLERESDAQREARQEALEAKVHPDIEEWAQRKSLPSSDAPKYVRRPQAPELKVKCPWCKATPGKRCSVPRTDNPLKGFHPSRTELASAK